MTAAWPKNMPRSLDYPNVGIDAILEGAAHDYPNRLAYEQGEQSITYRELREQARRVAGGLRARGIASGDVIAFHMPNSLSFMVAYYGTMLAGAAVAALNPAQPTAALRQQLESVAPKAIVTSASCASIAVEAAPASVEFLVGVPGGGELPAGVTPLADLLAAEPVADVRIDPNQVAHLQMTGGTTGVSKAVRALHRNVVANVVQQSAWRAATLPRVDEEGRLHLDQVPEAAGEHMLTPGAGVHVAIAPFFHGLGLVGNNVDLALGTTVLVAGGFDPERMLADIEARGVTQLIGSPPMYYAMLRSPSAATRDLSSVRILVSGAAPIDTTALGQLRRVFPNADVMEGYGLSEATMGVSSGAINSEVETPVGSIGIPIFDTEVDLRDSHGAPVAVGDVGEMWVRGPQVTDGYQGQPELTAIQFRDGWLLTGDLARRDEDGFLYIVGRSKDMIIYKGYNVYPQQLEDIACSHPAVAQAAVVGKPSEIAGEIPVAFVVLRPGADETATLADEIITHVGEQVAPYQKVREVIVLDALPTTPTGKVSKNVLRERFATTTV
ncbi:MAG TPA: class I adenylate-forming enzyme family protein [Aldersonia sp.]